MEGVIAELDLHPLHIEQFLILADQGVARLADDAHQSVHIQFIEGGDHGQAADEFRDEAVSDQILRLHIAQDVPHLLFVRLAAHLGAETDAALLGAVADDAFKAGEGAAADEEDVGGVHLQELLLGVFAPPLRRHRGDGALDEFQQGLLHPLAGHIPGDGGVVGLARDLVYLVDIDDADLGLLHIVVALLQQFLNDVLHILAHIAGLGEGGGVGDGEGHIQQPRQGLGQQGLAGAGGADEQDVALAQFHIVGGGGFHAGERGGGGAGDGAGTPLVVFKALVVVIHRHRQHLLGVLLADDIFVEGVFDLLGGGEFAAAGGGVGALGLLADYVVAEVDALVADEHGGAGDELAHIVLALAAERAVEQ